MPKVRRLINGSSAENPQPASTEARLVALAKEITKAHRAVEAAKKTSLDRAKEAGLKLLEAKRLVTHGEWLPWLKSIGLPKRTAGEYMQIARLPANKLATIANLGFGAALDAIRQPRPDPAAQRGQPKRDGPDFWPTPDCLISALVEHVIPTLPAGPIWECAAGDGRLASAIEKAGRRVIMSDLFPQNLTTAHLDFLSNEPPPDARGAIIVTNPPFNKTDEFLARNLDLFDDGLIAGFVLLMRHDHLASGKRVPALNRHIRTVFCNWRPIWIPESTGNPRWSFHWLSWHKGKRQPSHFFAMTPGARDKAVLERAEAWPLAAAAE